MKLASSVTLSGFDAEMFDDDLLHPIGSLAHVELPPFCFCAALAMRLGALQVARSDARGTARSAAPMRDAASLTPGEIELARSVFGDAIDYSKVRLFEGKWWPFQPRRVGDGADGQHLVPPRRRRLVRRFLEGAAQPARLFIHEMTHVWQAQKGGRFYLPLMRHPFCRYGYQLKPGKPFERYGLEQQAEIVRHRFLATAASIVADVRRASFCPSCD